jgi:hypothetical protein
MKKPPTTFFPPRGKGQTVSLCGTLLAKAHSEGTPSALQWAQAAVEDDDIFSGLLELVLRHRIGADVLISFLQE